MRVIYTNQAWLSIESSIAFLFKEGLSESKVREIIDDVIKKADSLALYPHLGQVEHLLSSRPKEYGRLVSGHFKIIYFIEGDVVYVTDIFDCRQDPKKMLG